MVGLAIGYIREGHGERGMEGVDAESLPCLPCVVRAVPVSTPARRS